MADRTGVGGTRGRVREGWPLPAIPPIPALRRRWMPLAAWRHRLARGNFSPF